VGWAACACSGVRGCRVIGRLQRLCQHQQGPEWPDPSGISTAPQLTKPCRATRSFNSTGAIPHLQLLPNEIHSPRISPLRWRW
jgi:hypothetical protein